MMSKSKWAVHSALTVGELIVFAIVMHGCLYKNMYLTNKRRQNPS